MPNKCAVVGRRVGHSNGPRKPYFTSLLQNIPYDTVTPAFVKPFHSWWLQRKGIILILSVAH